MSVDKLVDSTQLDADLTSVANAIRTKGGTSAQLAFPSGFVSAINAISTGGSPVVASGTFTGSGTYQQTVALGAKVPVKNFVFIAEIATNTLANDTNYKIVHYTYLYDGSGGFVKQGNYYYPVTGKDYTVGDSTTKTLLGFSGEATFMRNTNNFDGYRVPVTGTDHQYRKGTDTINFRIDTGNGNYKFLSGETYNWKLIYFGSNYDNESITYSGF